MRDDLSFLLAASHFANTQSAAGRLSQPRPVPYRNDRAPRPLPRTMRPPEARANDPRLAWDEQSRALAELQRNRDMGRTALEGQAQTLPDPYELDTPLKRGVLGVARAYGPGAAYDAMFAGARIAGGDNSADAWGGLAMNTGIAALPFLGVRGLRGEHAPAPMRETATPLPSQAWNTFGDLPPAEAPRPVAPDAGHAGLDTSRVAYRGLGRPYDPANGGYYQAFTSSEADAREYGSHVMAAHLRPGRNLAVDGGGNNFNALSVEQLPADVRARLHPGAGSAVTTDQIAHAAREAGYDSVTVRNVHDNRWGERPAAGSSPRTIDFVFNTRNISPLDHVPSQPIEGGAAPGKVRLSDSDRALLAELESPVAPDGGGAGAPTATERYPFGFRPVSDEPWAQSRLRTDQFYPVDTARDYGDAAHAPEIAPTDVPVDSLVGTQESIGSRFLNRPSTGNEPVSVYRAEDGQMYIIDGHHRVAGAVARGEPTVSARVYSPENPPINTREPEIQATLDARLRPEFDGGQWHIVENGQRLRTLPQGTTARDAMRAADEMRRTRPPPTDPKSLPRRKPPSGGSFMGGR